MLANVAKEELAGYLSIGLALMNDKRSIQDISGVVKNSRVGSTCCKQAAIALGKLGDKTVADDPAEDAVGQRRATSRSCRRSPRRSASSATAARSRR
jgi:hypothetical protein